MQKMWKKFWTVRNADWLSAKRSVFCWWVNTKFWFWQLWFWWPINLLCLVNLDHVYIKYFRRGWEADRHVYSGNVLHYHRPDGSLVYPKDYWQIANLLRGVVLFTVWPVEFVMQAWKQFREYWYRDSRGPYCSIFIK